MDVSKELVCIISVSGTTDSDSKAKELNKIIICTL